MINRSVAFLFVLLAVAPASGPPGLAQDAEQTQNTGQAQNTAQAQNAAPAPSAGQVKVELTPATLELPAQGEAQTQLILRNRSKGELRNVKLTWFSGTGAVIKADEGQELVKLAPQAETYWTLHLSQEAGGLLPGNVYFRVSYDTAGEAGVPQVLYATLAVSLRQSDVVSTVVDVTPQTASKQLNEQRPGQVFLLINNKSNLPISVGEITTRGPSFISGTPNLEGMQPKEGVFTVAPRDSVSVPVDLKVTDAVRPGKHLLVFRVPVEWGPQGNRQKASVIAKEEFDVGILGESELLTALGLPSFLILPGFLMLITFRLLSRKGAGDESVLKNATNPALWIGAITLSGVMAFLYPFGTRLLGGVSRNYLIGYGLGDVIRVWVASILLGLAAYLITWLFKYVWRWLLRPGPRDRPARLLKKLAWQRLGVSLYELEVTVNGKQQTLFQLERRRDNQETFWVGPHINIEWLVSVTPQLTASDPGRAKAIQDFKTKVADQLEEDGSARALAALIEEGERSQMLRASWDAATGLNGPREVKKNEVASQPETKDVIAQQV